MTKYVVLHKSGDYFGPKYMTPLAGCAEQFTEKQAHALFGHRVDCRILPYLEVTPAYDGKPLEVLRGVDKFRVGLP